MFFQTSDQNGDELHEYEASGNYGTGAVGNISTVRCKESKARQAADAVLDSLRPDRLIGKQGRVSLHAIDFYQISKSILHITFEIISLTPSQEFFDQLKSSLSKTEKRGTFHNITTIYACKLIIVNHRHDHS